MNGFQIKAKKIVVDTNVFFMSLYNPEGKAGKIINSAIKGKIHLFSPDTVKEELYRVLKKEIGFSDYEINFIIDNLPVTWVDRGIYKNFIDKTKVKYKADKPIEALSLVLDCGVLSADKHFKNRINVNELLKELGNN